MGGAVQNASPDAYGDVIGNPNFSIYGMTVILSGAQMTVAITGSYFSAYDSNLSVGGTYDVQDFGPGDLYISSGGWRNDGSANFKTDTFTAGEGWDYVVSKIDNKIYKLNFDGITPTNVPPGSWVYRGGQAWTGGYGAVVVGDANATMNKDGLTFIFDTTNMNLGSEIGLHWTMRCGNDVVEGSVPIPEPATLLLLGSGLIALGILSRRRFKARS